MYYRPLLFIFVTDRIFKQDGYGGEGDGLKWLDGNKPADLDFTDVIEFLVETLSALLQLAWGI